CCPEMAGRVQDHHHGLRLSLGGHRAKGVAAAPTRGASTMRQFITQQHDLWPRRRRSEPVHRSSLATKELAARHRKRAPPLPAPATQLRNSRSGVGTSSEPEKSDRVSTATGRSCSEAGGARIQLSGRRVGPAGGWSAAIPADRRIRRHAWSADAPGRRAGGLHRRFRRGGRAQGDRRASPPNGKGWLHEIKFDGWRIQLHKQGPTVAIYTKNG